MSLLNALYDGTSGLTAEGDALGVIGNNVSNANTVGFKESRAVFEDVLGGETSNGVRMVSTQQIFAEGSLQSTGQPTDIALNGDGFFVVKGNVNGVNGDYYTRAGQTTLNASGVLVNPQGLALQGYAAQPGGTFASSLSDVKLSTAALPPKATGTVNITANLDATAPISSTPFDPLNPAATSSFSTSVTVYDSTGSSHNVDVYFKETASGSWDYHALAAGSEVSGGTAGQGFEIGTGTLTFDGNGALQNVTSTSASASFNGATANQAINFNFGSPTGSGGSGTDGITQYGASSAVSAQSQDGYASGSLTGVTIGADGTVNGNYTNGQSIAVAQLGVAKFTSNTGLAGAGNGLWSATAASGDPGYGQAGVGGRASIVSGALEQSNVDVASQFVDMISHQSSFQASSKTITTVQQMLQDVMNMKQ
jgi:flagellar hook protein FlgE